MPDPTKQTLSATQTPALFGVSPYLTRWMLLRNFIHGDAISDPGDNRMNWGLKLQPLILQQAAEDLHLEVRPNDADVYIRRGLLGCTRDAEVICPDRGPGSLETKCVFDLGVWTRDWDGGKKVPRHYEIQLQQQMMVGDGDNPMDWSLQYDWGVLAVWCCGEIHYFERKPIMELWIAIKEESEKFFDDVHAKREGDPFGEPVEMPLMKHVFPVVEGETLDLRHGENANKFAEKVRLLDWAKKEASIQNKTKDKLEAELEAVFKQAETVLLLNGITVTAKQIYRKGYTRTVEAGSYKKYNIYVPENLPDPHFEEVGG